MQQATSKPQTDNEIPGLKGLPLVGNLPQFQRRPLATLIKVAREGGDVVRITLGSQRYYLPSKPDLVRHVLQGNNSNYVKGYGNLKVLLGNGLVLREGVSLATPATPDAAGLPPPASGRGSRTR